MTSSRRWLKVLLALFIVQSVFLSSLAIKEAAEAAFYGGFRYGCPSLRASSLPVSNNSIVRWVRMDCPNGPALRLSASWFQCGAHENSCTRVVPTFVPPPGLLGLYAVDHANLLCPDRLTPPDAGVLLVSGIAEVYGAYGFPALDLDYCAAIRNSGGTLNGFDLQWSLGEGKGTPSFHSSYQYNQTVARGHNTTLIWTLTSENQFYGNLSLGVSSVFRANATIIPSVSINPQNLILEQNSSNSTSVTIQASAAVTPGLYFADLSITPIYGLRFYGDFSPNPVSNGLIVIDIYVT